MSYKFCVAPMIDYTDKHCRYFLRKITKRSRLYSEMMVADTIINGNRDFFLSHDLSEHPLALQIAGSDPKKLAEAASIGESYGFDEINFNLGCPSRRVQEGNFGACLMNNIRLVQDCVASMKNRINIPVTIKCRIGVDENNPYEVLPKFIENLTESGITTFIIHARKAILNGLDPRQNREIPPLDYDLVRLIKRKWPNLNIILNGGIKSPDQGFKEMNLIRGSELDGVMLGRAVYIDPYILSDVDRIFFEENYTQISRFDLALSMIPYLEGNVKNGVPLNIMTRHMLGLFHGQRGAKSWRNYLSQESIKRKDDPHVLEDAVKIIKNIHREAA